MRNLNDKITFRSGRARWVNAALGACGLIFALILWNFAHDTTTRVGRAHHQGAVDICIAMAIVGIVILSRVLWSGTIILEADRLVFRTEARTVRLPKDEIADIDSGMRNRGVVRMSQPCVTMKSGKTRWLTDFSVPVTRDLSEQAEMVAAMKAWLGLKEVTGPSPSTLAGQVSSDGRSFWNGTAWVSTVSPDGSMQWAGDHWTKVSSEFVSRSDE